jgi:hypothetical protein
MPPADVDAGDAFTSRTVPMTFLSNGIESFMTPPLIPET